MTTPVRSRTYFHEIAGSLLLYVGIVALAFMQATMFKGIRKFHLLVPPEETVDHFYLSLWPFLALSVWLVTATAAVERSPLAILAVPPDPRPRVPVRVLAIFAAFFQK